MKKIPKFKTDALVKSRKIPRIVIPVKTGIQYFQHVTKNWTPVFTGVATFDEVVKTEAEERDFGANADSSDYVGHKIWDAAPMTLEEM
jgi:hypothetical protein